MKWLCIFSSLLWASNILLMKTLLNELMPLVVACWRVLFSCIVMGLFCCVKKLSFKVKFVELQQLFLLGFFNVALNFGLSFYGMSLISGTSIAMLNALNPVVIAGMSYIFLKKREVDWFSLLLTIVGVFLSFRIDFSVLEIGHLFQFLSIVCYAGSFLYAKKIKLHPLIISFYTMLFGSVFLFLYNVLLGQFHWLMLSEIQWFLFILISVLGFAFIQGIYFVASQKIGMKQTSFYMNLNPVFTYLGFLFILGEKFDLYSFGGAFLILIGLYISYRKSSNLIDNDE